jgi:hypothetical protein
MTSNTLWLGTALMLAGGAARAADAPNSLGDIFFAFDSSALDPDSASAVASTVTFAQAHPDTRIVLDAHCDPIGTNVYNVGLAIRRAESVRDQLVSLGVPHDQIVLAIYGEDGAPRATYAADRRVTVWSTRDPVAEVVDRTFTGDGVAVRWGRPMTVAELDAAPTSVATK